MGPTGNTMKIIFVVFALTATVFAGSSEADVPPKGKEITFPSAAGGPGIEEVGRTNVSLLTFGIARIEMRLDRLSDTHEAEFKVGYDAKERRIRISVTSRKMKATKENCGKLIAIVQEDAGYVDWNGESPPTRYAGFFSNAGEGAANTDSRIDIQVTVDNSIDTGGIVNQGPDDLRRRTCAAVSRLNRAACGDDCVTQCLEILVEPAGQSRPAP